MAGKPRPSDEELKGMLLEGHFAASTELPTSDPVTPAQLVLKLDEIKAYDSNPRRERNPAYDSIKDSIREQRGLNNPFTITRRPGDKRYMIQSGGNTRLAILQELYSETGDAIFNSVNCLYVPWQSESAVLTAHLIENELRGDMTLIDKAYAVRELKRQLEEEQKSGLSRSEFARLANGRGYKLSRRVLQRFDYALELDQLIPQMLRKGLGAHKIDAIKTTENAYRQYCLSKTDQFASLFAHIMTEHDGDNWDFEEVRRELDQQLAQLINSTPHRLRWEVDAILFNQTSAEQVSNTPSEKSVETKSLGTLTDQANVIQDTAPSDHHTEKSRQRNSNSTAAATESAHASESNQQADSQDNNDFLSPQFNETPRLPASDDLKSLYCRSYVLASRIAQSIQMKDLIVPIKHGLGFIIEKPACAFQTQDGWGLWWLLMGISEQSVSEDRLPCWQDTALYRLYAANDETVLNELIGDPPSLQLFPFQVLQNQALLSDPVFNDIFRLIETCRLIRRHFPPEQLWPAPSQP